MLFQGWATGYIPSEDNSIFKMGFGVVQDYTLGKRQMQRQIKQSWFQDSRSRESYKIKCKVSQGNEIT